MNPLRSSWPWLSYNDQVHWFAKRERPNDRRVAGGTARLPDSLIRTVQTFEALGFDLYVGLNPAREVWQKARRDDILVWRRVLIDLDPWSHDHTLSISKAIDHAIYLVNELIALPPGSLTIIHTGRGAQLWLELQPAVLGDSTHKQHIERGVARFLTKLSQEFGSSHGVRIDQCTSDLARVGRMPYTTNTKTGNRSEVLATAWNPVPAAIFDPWMISEEEPPRLNKSLTKAEVLLHLTWLADRYLHEGISEPGRHSAAWHTAKRLAELGVDREEAEGMVLVGAGMCRPPLPTADALRAVRQAYKETP